MSSTTYSTQPSPFDIAGIQRSIDTTMASLPANERGNVIISVRKGEGVKAALVARGPSIGPVKTEVIGWIVPPLMGKTLDYGGSVRVNWLVGQVLIPKPAPFAAVRGWYALLCKFNPRPMAALKALALCFGFDVKVMA